MAAGFVGGLDQPRAHFLKSQVEAQQGLDDGVGKFANEPVGAEKKQVTGLSFKFEDVGSYYALRSQRARNHILERRADRFFPAHLAHANLFFHKGVIERDLFQMRVAQAIPAAVAHIHHPRAAVFHQQRHECSAHAVKFLIALRARKNGLISGGDSLRRLDRWGTGPGTLGEPLHHLRNGQAAGNLACCSAAHPIAHHIHSMLDGKSKCIFVGRALAAAVGERRGSVMDDSRSQERNPRRSVYLKTAGSAGGDQGTLSTGVIGVERQRGAVAWLQWCVKATERARLYVFFMEGRSQCVPAKALAGRRSESRPR